MDFVEAKAILDKFAHTYRAAECMAAGQHLAARAASIEALRAQARQVLN